MKKGDKVKWESPQGTVEGKVIKKVTSDKKLGNKTYRASKDAPKVLVKSDKTGKEAIHKEETVKKR